MAVDPDDFQRRETENPYESDRLLAEYLLFHYGKPAEVLPYSFGPVDALDFAVRVVSACVDFGSLPAEARALDLGCAVGRSSFELARGCREVLGIDFSRNFVRAAARLGAGGRLRYERIDEGRLTTPCEAEVPVDIDRQRVGFEVGDACALRMELGRFDVVLLANLVDRLPDPRQCLKRLPDLVKPGGQLVIASPFTWLEDYTPRAAWLGGYENAGAPVFTSEALREYLEADFEFQRATDLPFLIREHTRKYQWSVSWAGTWRRR